MNHDGMPVRTVHIRPRAVEDIERHADYLQENATPDVALRFRAAIMNAVDEIAFMPGAGAPCEVQNPRLAGLRMRVVSEFRNYLVFYITPDGGIDILRVFHGAQDIKSILADEER